MRAFQLKTQRNITIVDLDDENEEADNKTEKDKDKHKGNERVATKEAEGTEPAATNATDNCKQTEEAEPMSVDTTTDETAKTDSDKAVPDVPPNKGDAAITEVAKAAESPSESNGQTKNDTIGNDKCEALKLQEPTLFELLNWLDNPPEDITFVSEFCITLEDFCEAVKVVQPSAKREGFITVPDVTWDDVGSLQDIREELKLAVLAPVKFPEKLARLGLSAPSGVLLCGPPGCGKTLLAKAIANEAGINFISVKGPELMNMVKINVR